MVGGDLLPPFSIAYVKGWRRSVTALIVAEAIRSLQIDASELTSAYKAGCVLAGSNCDGLSNLLLKI